MRWKSAWYPSVLPPVAKFCTGVAFRSSVSQLIVSAVSSSASTSAYVMFAFGTSRALFTRLATVKLCSAEAEA